MPMSKYRELLHRQCLPDLPPVAGMPQIIRTAKQDLGDPGRMGLVTLDRVGLTVALPVDACDGCKACVNECPAGALSIRTDTNPPTIFLIHALCNGVACRRCESACPLKVFNLNPFFGAATSHATEAEEPILRE
jgi:ferredoxin